MRAAGMMVGLPLGYTVLNVGVSMGSTLLNVRPRGHVRPLRMQMIVGEL